MKARVGKIARLPHKVREQVNRKLRDGIMAKKIAEWLNDLPEVTAVLTEHFKGEPIDSENVRQWKIGGYADWMNKQDRLEHTRELATFAAGLARANGASIAEGSAAIASGRILELLESCEELKPEALKDVIAGLTDLRRVEVQAQRVDVAKERLKQLDDTLALARQRFQRETCELFLKWRDDDRVRAIADGNGSNSEKIQKLGEAMFGDLWQQQTPTESSNAALIKPNRV